MTGGMHDGGPGKWFVAWYAFCAVLGLGLTGVLVWALITVVTHFAE